MSSVLKNKEVIFEQELPDLEEAKRRVKSSHAEPETEFCCPHLRAVLPHQLALDFVEGTKGIFLKDPIHALHLQSQFDRNESIHDWLLYGEEHEKSIAMQTAGYAEMWHPELKSDFSGCDPPVEQPKRDPNKVEQQELPKPDQKMPPSVASTEPPTTTPLSLPLGAPKTASSLPIFQQPVTTTSGEMIASSSAATAGAVTSGPKPEAAPTSIEPTPTPAKQQKPAPLLPDAIYKAYASEEQRIGSLRGSTMNSSTAGRRGSTSSNKRPKLLAPTVSPCTLPKEEYLRTQRIVTAQLILYLQYYRQSRHRYWRELKAAQTKTMSSNANKTALFGAIQDPGRSSQQTTLQCHSCTKGNNDSSSSNNNEHWDQLLQCLECSHIGCLDGEQHSYEHWLATGHNYAKVYCFRCSSFSSHTVFTQERDRVDLCCHLPWLAWKEHPIQRSFDAFWFSKLSFWKGMRATYPLSVPEHHVQAAQLFRKRQLIVQTSRVEAFRPPCPVGMYNLGNTCFMSSILQVMVHCKPLQNYFLGSMQHHHAACLLYRRKRKSKSEDTGAISGVPSRLLTKKKKIRVCLACELDKVFLQYTNSATGVHVLAPGQPPIERGTPLVTTGILTAAWKCEGMSHLAGYEQRDAHEFFHAFLEIVGQHLRQFRTSVTETLGRHAFQSRDATPTRKPTEEDEIKNTFGGMLRSVLICQDCGSKRSQSEPFFSLSLPLSKEIQLARQKMTVEQCLQHFTLPETLADPVACPACSKKTVTKKQHVISKLPKVLCLHLKRFDAAHNRKIEDYVGFPTEGMNMGHHLPHWSEVTMTTPQQQPKEQEADEESLGLEPIVLYDLFSTVNHFGNLQSGHYITNVKVREQWYHINDAHVGFATEAEVQKSDGAYLLFYHRRS